MKKSIFAIILSIMLLVSNSLTAFGADDYSEEDTVVEEMVPVSSEENDSMSVEENEEISESIENTESENSDTEEITSEEEMDSAEENTMEAPESTVQETEDLTQEEITETDSEKTEESESEVENQEEEIETEENTSQIQNDLNPKEELAEEDIENTEKVEKENQTEDSEAEKEEESQQQNTMNSEEEMVDETAGKKEEPEAKIENQTAENDTEKNNDSQMQNDTDPQAEDAEKEEEAETEDKNQAEDAEKKENDNSTAQKAAKAVQLVWPVPGHTSLSRGFHDGNAIDISDGSIAGANVVAAIGGTVTHIYLCGTQHYGSMGDCNGFGIGLVIAGDDGRTYQYAHMKAGSIPSNVYKTARVSTGQTIGAVGTTGNSSGNHLHFAISIGDYWNASGINPEYENYNYSGAASIDTAWELTCDYADTTNAIINGKISVNQRVQFSQAGAYIWNPEGNLVAQPSESTTVSGTYMNIRYDMGMELGVWLNPGTTYTYQFWAVTGGKTYTSGKSQFTTTGKTPIQEVKLMRTTASLDVGDQLTLSATIVPSYANDKSITWTTSNQSVATVSNGTVKAVGAGTATITAKSHDGKSAQCSITVEKKVITVNPVTLTIGGRAGDALRLNWQKNSAADGYIIEQYKGGQWVRIARIGNNSTVTYRVENLTPFTTYQFRIKAFKMEGTDVGYSSYRSVTGKTNPATVKNFKIGGRAGDALRLNWAKNSTASGYIIEQYKGGQWVRIARIGSNSTVTYRVAGLKPLTTYQFRIRAFNFEGSASLYSAYATISGKTNPSVMAGVKIGGRAGDALRLNWAKNSTASGYIIEQKKNGQWIRVARIASSSIVTYRVAGLKPLTTYQFRIQAFNYDGATPIYGSYAAVSGKTNPSVVTGAKIGGYASDALRLNWSKNSTASGYIIEQKKNGQWVRIARIGNASTVTYRVANLKPSTTYQFRIQAFNFDGSTPLYGAYASVIGTTYGPRISNEPLSLDKEGYPFDEFINK